MDLVKGLPIEALTCSMYRKSFPSEIMAQLSIALPVAHINELSSDGQYLSQRLQVQSESIRGSLNLHIVTLFKIEKVDTPTWTLKECLKRAKQAVAVHTYGGQVLPDGSLCPGSRNAREPEPKGAGTPGRS